MQKCFGFLFFVLSCSNTIRLWLRRTLALLKYIEPNILATFKLKMCATCDFIESVFTSAKLNSHQNYLPVFSLLCQIEKQKRIEMIAGDCELEETQKILFEETHYTVEHYFKCLNCEKYFLIGACIRGTPIFKILNSFTKEEAERALWGRVGTYFINNR